MSYQELKVIHALSRKQALLGVMLGGLQRMGEAAVTVRPEENDAYGQLIMKWVGEGAVIARQNKKVDADVAGLFTDLNEIGFECCLLKGQGNARLYPRPEERTSGDIDVWVRPKREKREGSAKEQKRDIMEVISLAKDADPSARAIYHHVEYLPHEGTEVELHYRPQFMSGFRYNAKLQRYFREHADAQFSHKLLMEGHMIAVPTWEFNVVSQTSHIFEHLFHEGIGLRQLMDYFYLLTSVGEARKSEYLCKAVLKRLGLKEIAGALCWILVEKFGMEERYCVAEPDSVRGRFVLSEILAGGNFGQFDKRRRFGDSAIGRNMERFRRDVRLLRYFPAEALSEPLFRLYHAFWRMKYNNIIG